MTNLIELYHTDFDKFSEIFTIKLGKYNYCQTERNHDNKIEFFYSYLRCRCNTTYYSP